MSDAARSVMIVDDERPARDRLARLVGEMSDWHVAGSCASANEALELAASVIPDVVLLDIEMPGLHGIDAARELRLLKPPPAVIFTTAYDRYALDAFDSQAVGYLLKPVRRERLADALSHALRFVEADRSAKSASRVQLAVRSDGELQLIAVEDVLYFRAAAKQVYVRHPRGEALIGQSLKTLEADLGDRFVRVRRDLLVSAAHIEALMPMRSGGQALRLRGADEQLPVSRRHLAELRRWLVKGALAGKTGG